MRLLIKPWPGREDGRLVVVKNNRVVFSKHYRNLSHVQLLISEINEVLKWKKTSLSLV